MFFPAPQEQYYLVLGIIGNVVLKQLAVFQFIIGASEELLKVFSFRERNSITLVLYINVAQKKQTVQVCDAKSDAMKAMC